MKDIGGIMKMLTAILTLANFILSNELAKVYKAHLYRAIINNHEDEDPGYSFKLKVCIKKLCFCCKFDENF